MYTHTHTHTHTYLGHVGPLLLDLATNAVDRVQEGHLQFAKFSKVSIQSFYKDTYQGADN